MMPYKLGEISMCLNIFYEEFSRVPCTERIYPGWPGVSYSYDAANCLTFLRLAQNHNTR
jgi:hypothetical protein